MSEWPFGTFFLLLSLGALFAAFCYLRGYTLYWGDAEAHLEIARATLDSRTPGYDQIGSVWLPLPHVLMMPFVLTDWLWRTGLAGAIPNVICFALAGTALFSATRRIFRSSAAAWCAVAIFGTNPNVLYLQSIPMSEAVMLAALLGLLYFTVVFAETRSLASVAGAGLCAAAGALTRYEGWFLLPFVACYMLMQGGQNRWKAAILFSAIAGLAPLYWLGHNYYLHQNFLEFYNGPYSARAIYSRGHPPGTPPFPAVGDWPKAFEYYRAAAEFCSGTVVFCLGVVGVAAVFWKRAWWPVTLLALIPAFYVISLHSASSGTEIFVPTLWPHSYYNTRYGIGALPLLVLAASALVAILPERVRSIAAGTIVAVALIPWISYPRPENWVTWKESQVNSSVRRQWTTEAADYLRTHYRPGDGVFLTFSDLIGVLREAGIPLREALHDGNNIAFDRAVARPDLFLHEEWALAIAADPVSSAMMKVNNSYRCVRTIFVKDGPVIEMYRRVHEKDPIHQSPWSPQRLSADVGGRVPFRP